MIEDLLYLLKNKYPNVDLNKSHINRIIKDNNITLKITRIRHEPVKRFGKDIDINVNIRKFYEKIKKYKYIINIIILIMRSPSIDNI